MLAGLCLAAVTIATAVQVRDSSSTEADTGAATQVRKPGCGTDLDCKGDRICVNGRCVEPAAEPQQDARVEEDGRSVTADAQSANEPSSVESILELHPAVGAHVLLVRNKPTAVMRLRAGGERMSLNVAAGVMTARGAAAREMLSGPLLGGVFSVYPTVRFPAHQLVEVAAGVGLDVFALWGVNLDEYKLGVPVLLEVQSRFSPSASVYVEVRYYLYRSEGLGVNEPLRGGDRQPVLVALGCEWRWI